MTAIRPAIKAFLSTGIRKKLIYLSLLCLFTGYLLISNLHQRYFGSNVTKTVQLFIHDGDNFDKVLSLLKESNCLNNPETFRHLAWLKDYDNNVRPGAYKIQPGWSSNKLVNVLRSGSQTPVMVTFNNIRTREDLAGRLSKQLQCDSLTFLALFKNDSSALRLGFKPETLPALFIPNTYSFYWTTSANAFLTRMKREYDLYWNEPRRLKAQALGLTTEQVSTLASIVQEESNKNDEKPVIAGVYLNRLSKGWPLQADPTVRYAMGDFTIRRILDEYLKFESPYNTYLHTGLPPGPINFPEISSLEAVLNHQVHDFFYFCAKEDFSGYHNFAVSLSEHNRNAQKYQAALNKMKVFK